MLDTLLIKYQTYLRPKYLIYAAVPIVIFLSYKLYIWSNTQTTDNAYIEADISNVGCEVKGIIRNVLIYDNMEVQKGEIIAEIDQDDYLANFNKANSDIRAKTQDIRAIEQQILIEQINLKKAEQAQDATKSNLTLAELEYAKISGLNRSTEINKQAANSLQLMVEKAKSEYEQADLEVQINQQNLLLLDMRKSVENANLESLQQTQKLADRALANTKLRSPTGGRLANSKIRPGYYIQPGMVLYSVVPNKMYVKANFKETQIAKFKPDMKAQIKFDAAPSLEIYGIIRNISPAAGSKFSLLPPDNATGNFTKIVQRIPVIIDFTLPERVNNLVPGMSVKVSIRTDQ